MTGLQAARPAIVTKTGANLRICPLPFFFFASRTDTVQLRSSSLVAAWAIRYPSNWGSQKDAFLRRMLNSNRWLCPLRRHQRYTQALFLDAPVRCWRVTCTTLRLRSR
ncbi:hypothetical protein RSK60_470003 [Ralstonia solanacearum K60]|nr:hypothetical protein RSK60_470003 [Ralstonia solanacearum K60]